MDVTVKMRPLMKKIYPKFKVGDNVRDILSLNTKGPVLAVYKNIEGIDQYDSYPFIYMVDSYGFHVPLFESQLVYETNFEGADEKD